MNRLFSDLPQDLRYGLRTIHRNPGFAITAMMCLGLGIGVNATVFSFLDAIFFRQLAVPEPDRVVTIDRNGGPPCSWRDYQDFRAALRAFTGMAAYITKGTFFDIERVNGEIYVETVTANYSDVLELKPQLGRWLIRADEAAASDPTVVISNRLWNSQFRRDPQVVGTTMRIENQLYRVVGVAEPQFRGVSAPLAIDAWVPLATYPEFRPMIAGGASRRGPRVSLIGRLASDATVQSAAAEMKVVDTRIPHATRTPRPIHVGLFSGFNSPDARRTALPVASLLAAVVAIVLLIACVNVANLLLSRAAVRRREMATRQSLGASRARLIRQCLTEGILLSTGGAVLGLLFGLWTNRAISYWLSSSIPDALLYAIDLDVNWRVALWTCGASLLCAILFSISPALEQVKLDLGVALKGGPASAVRGWRQRDLYVVAQVALSLMLLIAAGLLLRALHQAGSIDPGFATSNRLYVRLFTPEPDFTPESSTLLFSRLLEEVRALPGVRDATLSFALLGFGEGDCVSLDRITKPVDIAQNFVEPNYFRVMETPLLRGRTFSPADRPSAPRVIVVNETMARRWWPDQEAIGKLVWIGCEGRPRVQASVIGIARDSKYRSLDEQPQPSFYVSRSQVWWNGYFALILHTSGNPYSLAQPLLKVARTGGDSLRIYEMQSLDDYVALSLWRLKWQAALLGIFGLLAIVLSAIGLYGLVAYTVAQRTHEIGVRMALGARANDVRWMVLSRGLRLAAAGVATGIALSAIATRFLRAFLYGVSPLDPTAFGAACLIWIVVAMLASYLPALRATRVDPVASLRYE